MLVLATLSPALADPCKNAQPALRKVARELQDLAKEAAEAAVTCDFHGADADRAATLRDHAKRVAADEQTVAKWEACKVNPLGLTVTGVVSQEDTWLGTRFTAAELGVVSGPYLNDLFGD